MWRGYQGKGKGKGKVDGKEEMTKEIDLPIQERITLRKTHMPSDTALHFFCAKPKNDPTKCLFTRALED